MNSVVIQNIRRTLAQISGRGVSLVGSVEGPTGTSIRADGQGTPTTDLTALTQWPQANVTPSTLRAPRQAQTQPPGSSYELPWEEAALTPWPPAQRLVHVGLWDTSLFHTCPGAHEPSSSAVATAQAHPATPPGRQRHLQPGFPALHPCKQHPGH